MSRLNCWDVVGCGLQEGGPKAQDSGPCPVSGETRLNGVHGGKNGGRACWVVLGTRCGGTIQAGIKEKYGTCGSCRFYRSVQREEDDRLELTVNLLKRLETD